MAEAVAARRRNHARAGKAEEATGIIKTHRLRGSEAGPEKLRRCRSEGRVPPGWYWGDSSKCEIKWLRNF